MPAGSGAQTKVNILFNVKGVRKTQQQIRGLGLSAKTASGHVSGLGMAFKAMGLAIGTTALINGTKVIANFGQEMATVRAVTGATQEQFERMSDEAQRLGSITRYTAQQAAEGMKFLGMAGFNTDQIMQSAEATLRLAQAGALDLGRAADFSSNILIGFNLHASEMGRVVDVMAKAATSSNTNITQLGEAMKFVAPVAAGMGVSLEETTAAISALSDAGLQASLAGTGLRRVLAELVNPGKKLRDILRAFGMTVNDINPDKVGSLEQAIKNLADTGIPVEEALAVFQQRGGPAFQILKKSVMETKNALGETENKFGKFVDLYEDATGAALEMANVMDDTLMGAFFRVRSAIQAVAIVIGKMGLEEWAKNTLDKVAQAILVFANDVDKLKNAMKIMGVVGVAVFGKALVVAIGLATKAVIAFFIALGPIGWFSLALSGIIGLFYKFRDQIKLTEKSSIKLWNVFKHVINDAVIPALKEAWRLLKNFGKELLGFTKTGGSIEINWMKLGDSLIKALDFMIKAWKGFFAFVDKMFELMVNKVAARRIDQMVNDFTTGLASKFASIPGGESIAKKLFDGIFKSVGDAKLGEAAEMSFAEIVSAAIDAGNLAKLEYVSMFDGIREIFRNAIEKEAFASLFAHLSDSANAADQLAEAEKRRAKIMEGANLLGVKLLRQQAEAEEDKAAAEYRNTLLKRSVLDMVAASQKFVQKETRDIRAKLALEKAMTWEAEKQAKIQALFGKLKDKSLIIDPNDPAVLDYGNALEETRALEEDWMHGAKKGWFEYSENIRNVADNVSNVFINAFQGMEDALVSFLTTGKLEWREMINSMISDLVRLMIQQSIMKPLAGGVGSIFGFSGGGGGASRRSDLGVLNWFAKGGVVDQATGFTFGNNKKGVMGEAGPEAIMPLMKEGTGYSIHTASGKKLLITRLSNGIMGVDDTTKPQMFGMGGIVGGAESARSVGTNSTAPTAGTTANTFSPNITINVENSGGQSSQMGQEQAEKISAELDKVLESKMIEFTRNMQRPGNQLNRGLQF